MHETHILLHTLPDYTQLLCDEYYHPIHINHPTIQSGIIFKFDKQTFCYEQSVPHAWVQSFGIRLSTLLLNSLLPFKVQGWRDKQRRVVVLSRRHSQERRLQQTRFSSLPERVPSKSGKPGGSRIQHELVQFSSSVLYSSQVAKRVRK